MFLLTKVINQHHNINYINFHVDKHRKRPILLDKKKVGSGSGFYEIQDPDPIFFLEGRIRIRLNLPTHQDPQP